MYMTDNMASMDIVYYTILIASCVLKYAECKSEDASVSDMIANNSFDGKSCTIDRLDDKSWKECGDRGYIMNCGQLQLKDVPHTYPALNGTDPHLTPPLCLLNLSDNVFITLKNKSFVNAVNMNSTDIKWLYLYYCHLEYIESDAFMNLSRLIYLNLTGNYLTWPDGFGVEVFRPLISLTNINFYGNDISTFKGFGQELQYMKQLNGLFIDLCENCTFGKGFENLTRLTNLSLSQIADKHSCNATIIYNDTFKYVSKVQHLFIGSCHIREIKAGAFSPLKELVKLDLSYNEELHFEGMNTALYGLRNSTTLKILNVNRIHEIYGLGVMLKITDMENLKTLQALEVLHMDLNKIEVLEEDIPRNCFPKTMTNLTLSGNRLTYGKYIRNLIDVKGVVHIDISRQHLDYDPFFFERFESSANLQLEHTGSISVTTPVYNACSCSSHGVMCLPENIESFQWRKSFLWFKMDGGPTILRVCGAYNLKLLDLSFNLISTWNLIIYGFENVTDLDLSMNNCDTVFQGFFRRFKGLKRLNVSRNLLGSAINNIESSKQLYLFKGMTKLEEIDLSSNMITHVHEDMFKNLSSIKRLYLGNNLLTNWNTSLEKSRCLVNLSLTNNKLNVLEEATTMYLDSLTTESCYSSVDVDLSENPLDCACSHLHFLRWARDTLIRVKMSDDSDCSIQGKRYPLRSTADLQDIINILEGDVCKHEDRMWVTWVASSLSVVGTGFLSAISCFLVYKNRWKLRYLYNTRHRRHVLEGYDRLFQYDVFISYPKSLGSFMKRSAVPMLEGIHHLVTWVYDKDSIPGISMAENITHAINNSKKVVLLLNREFLKDSWCEYETNMAYVESISTKRKMIIIVTMEQIEMEELPLYLRRLLMTERSVEYPEQGQDESTFWMNLAEETRA